jgi:hypothetical protein
VSQSAPCACGVKGSWDVQGIRIAERGGDRCGNDLGSDLGNYARFRAQSLRPEHEFVK